MIKITFNFDDSKPKSLEERYFSEIRPQLYKRHATHYQYGVRKGRSLAEHLDSACQFILTVSKKAQVSDEKRPRLLAAIAVHDLNKLDASGRNVKKLARDREFLREQLKLACVSDFVVTEEDYELVRRLIERHSGHNVSDGMRFFPEDEDIEKWAAMLIGADLFDLGIEEAKRIRKVENELTVAFGRPSYLLKVSLSENKGYLSALLLNSCEEVLLKHKLTPLAIFPDGEIFEGETLPQQDLTREIAKVWQQKINQVFGGNIDLLVHATKDGIKIDAQAIEQNIDETLVCVQAQLEKKKAGFKADKVKPGLSKYAEKAGQEAVIFASKLGLLPVNNAEEFAISEGLKAVYLSYREAGLSPQKAWDNIAEEVGLSQQQREALEAFDALYGRCLFAAKAASRGMEGVKDALRKSFQMRLDHQSTNVEVSEEDVKVSEEIILAVSRMLNFPRAIHWQGIKELDFYINANPKQRCSLGTTSSQVEELMSNNMPPGTKVQAFSNRLPGGMNAEPKRRGDTIASLAYQLMTVGANFPSVNKQDLLYLHFALPAGTSPELLRFWRKWLKSLAATNTEGGTVTIDKLKLYRDIELEFKPNKVVGFAFPKRDYFIHSTVIIPVVWGDVNASVALLKSLRLALELSLAFELGFPFVLGGNIEVESWGDSFGRVEGIPSSLQAVLGNGKYNRQDAEKIRQRLRCLGQLTISVASLQKKDDCLYDLARATRRPLDLYYVLLRWILRENDEPNLEYFWNKIRQPLHDLLESLMGHEIDLLTQYLKEAAYLAEEARLRGNSFRRTAQAEPFTAFIAAIRSRKSHLPWDVVFAALTQDYHTRLDRIREHGVGKTKYDQVKKYYDILRRIFDEIYQSRPEKLLADKKTLEAAYLFFLQEARQQLKQQSEEEKPELTTTK